MHEPPPPGQWSPDRKWWWDGRQWVPASQVPAPPPPPVYTPPLPPPPTYMPQQAPPASWPLPPPPPSTYWQQPTPGLEPSPGLRVFLLVFLALMVLASGLLTLVGTIAILSGSTDSASFILFAVVVILFGLSLAGTIGVARQSAWSRAVAIIAGFAVSLTCIGLLLGIPILVAAFRAPDLTRRPAAPPDPVQTA